jgi:hypothetical protein
MNACGPGRSGCGLFGRLRGPSCGCEIAACDPCCSAAPSCGCEIAPSCGCESACGSCCQPRRRPFLELIGRMECHRRSMVSRLTSHRACCDTGCGAAPSCGCEIAAPSCGCEVVSSCGGCDCGCAPRAGLLSRLFQRRHAGCDVCCDSGCTSCGNGFPVAAPAVNGDAAPMPPAPVVDPSAYLQSNRRVVQATSFVR